MSRIDPSDDPVAHLPALQRYALALTRHTDAADDLVQDALLKAYRHRKSYAGRGLRAWLFGIMHNTFHDDRRRAARELRRQSGLALVAESVSEPAQEHVVRLAQLQEAFLELGDDQREAMHLVVVEGLTYQQAADALDIPLGTVMSRLARARTALRRLEVLETQRPASPQLRIVGGSDDH